MTEVENPGDARCGATSPGVKLTKEMWAWWRKRTTTS